MQNERLFRSSKEKEHNVRPAEEHKVCYNKNLCIFCSSFFAPLYRLHEIWLWRVLKLIAIANNKIVKKFFSYPCSLKRRIFGTIFWDFFGNESIRAWISKNVQVPCLTNNQSKSSPQNSVSQMPSHFFRLVFIRDHHWKIMICNFFKS